MITLPDRALGAPIDFKPLSPMLRAEKVLRDLLPVLDPPSRITVTDAARQNIRVQHQGVWGQYDPATTPYMIEPSNMTQDRRFKTVVFVGPSQSGKTLALQTTALFPVTCDPSPVLVVHMSRPERDKWVEGKFGPMIANSPKIRARLRPDKASDTFSRKRFSGMQITLGYPTPNVLSGGTYQLVLLTDYDHHPAKLGRAGEAEGTGHRMALQRIKSYLSRGCVFVESSPAYPVNDASWSPSSAALHEMPPVEAGVVKLYNTGTRARWYWECPDCGDEFEPRIDRLHYDEALDPHEAGAQAEMECPHCGVLIGARHKMELNRAALSGRGGWRHVGLNGTPTPLDGDLIRTDVVSYALNGAAATFGSWSEIVANLETARRQAEITGDDTDLATVHYTEIGVPHVPFRAAGDEIGLQFLRDEGHDEPRGVAPNWTRFVTVSIDVQGTYFAVQFTAWGEGSRAQVIDRIDLTAPPEGAPHSERDAEGHTRRLDPARYAEDWAVLEPLIDRVIPISGAQHGLKPVAAVVDFHGAPGVSDNAEAFWNARRMAGVGQRWFVSRGHGGLRQLRRVWYEAPERRSGGGRARSIMILNFATDRLKDTVSQALKRGAAGQGGLLLGRWMSDEGLSEFVAEERTSKGWSKRPGMVRNEGMDLSTMARALAEHFGLERINFDAPPEFASLGVQNSFAVLLDGNDTPNPASSARPASGQKGPKRAPRSFL